VKVTVKPAPTLNSLTIAPAVCSGAVMNYIPTSSITGASFSWTRPVQTFISNAASTGNGDPAEILINTSVNTVSVIYNYTINANGCTNQQSIIVPVKPTPNISNQSVTTCSNTAFNFSATNVPTGTQYVWNLPVYTPAGTLTGGTAQPTAQSFVSEVLTNQTSSNATADYTVTASAGGCSGVPFTLSVLVQPTPTIANQTIAAVCSGTSFNYTPPTAPTGTSYTWSNPQTIPQNSLTGGSAQSVSQANISQTLSSTNNVSNTAVYTITPSLNGCAGNLFTLTVPVNPTPVVNDLFDTICTGSTFSVVPSPTPLNTRYTWSTPTVQPFGAVLGALAQPSPSGNIQQTLINTTNAPARVGYIVTPTASGCSGTPFNLLVSVGSNLPTIPNQAAQICSGTAFDATPLNAPPGSTYTWTLPVVTPAASISGISNMVFQQASVSQTLTNGTATNAVAVYTVVAKNTGCNSNSFTATVTVLPKPRVTVTGNNVICRYPTDTLTLTFTGAPLWSFRYTEDNGNPQNITTISTNPYKLVLPASATTSRTFAFTDLAFGSCLNTADTFYFTQQINPLPTGTLHTQRGIYLCNNIPDTLFVTSPDSLGYSWLYNGSAVAGLNTDSIATGTEGRYNVQITNKFGCMDTLPNPITLYKVNQPVLRLLYDAHCINLPLVMTNITDTNTTGPIAWSWDFGDGNIKSGYHSSNIYTVGGNHHIRLTAT
jgi:hypothetical protein